jgi:hypothetical protein
VKELAVALPLVLLAIERADRLRPASLRDALRATALHWIVVAGGLALYATSPTYGRLAAASLALRGAWPNALTHLHGLAWLGSQAVRPDLLDADPVIPAVARLDATATLTALALAAALCAGLALLRRRPAPALALLWAVLWLPLPGLVLPRPEAANGRQLYLALLGAGWLTGRALVALAGPLALREGRRERRGALNLLAAALLLVLGTATVLRNRVYADEVGFWEAALARSPGNARALNNLGFALAARCRTGEAEAVLVRAAAAAPEDFVPRVNLRLLREGEPLGPDEPRCPRAAAAPR